MVDVQSTSSAGIRLQMHPVSVARVRGYVPYCERLSRFEIPRRSASLSLHLAEEKAIACLDVQSKR